MKKWIFFVLALVLMINLAAMGVGCKAKELGKARGNRRTKTS